METDDTAEVLKYVSKSGREDWTFFIGEERRSEQSSALVEPSWTSLIAILVKARWFDGCASAIVFSNGLEIFQIIQIRAIKTVSFDSQDPQLIERRSRDTCSGPIKFAASCRLKGSNSDDSGCLRQDRAVLLSGSPPLPDYHRLCNASCNARGLVR